jgi:hypothetical protein
MKHPQYIGIDPKNEVELVNLSAEGRFNVKRVKEVKEMSSRIETIFMDKSHSLKRLIFNSKKAGIFSQMLPEYRTDCFLFIYLCEDIGRAQ